MAKVADAYLRIAEEHPERFVVIQSDRTPDSASETCRTRSGRLVRSHATIDTPAYRDDDQLGDARRRRACWGVRRREGRPPATPGADRWLTRWSAFPFFARFPGQEAAIRFLVQALPRPHHAYLLAGPEGGGKQQVARAFTAALLCADGGCGECRACALALADRHPNMFVVEPEGATSTSRPCDRRSGTRRS